MINIQKLDPREQKSDLVIALNKITARAFGKDVPIEETEERFRDADALFLVNDRNKVVGYGFNDIINLDGKTVNYFGSGFIEPEFQGQGLYEILNKERVQGILADVIMTRTQNPKVVSGFSRVCENLGYKISSNGMMTPSALRIARAYAPECTSELVCKGIYGRELMGNTPSPKRETARILSNVDPKKGDGIILIGERF